jgi:uncharacterized protein
MTVCFADTAYFIALVSVDDDAHQAAHLFTASYQGRVITTSAIVCEVANHLSTPPDRQAFAKLLEYVQNDPDVPLIHVDRAIFRQGLELFLARPDKEWSLTDCMSFVVMNRHKLKDALTTDHHYEQAGFRALLKEGKS